MTATSPRSLDVLIGKITEAQQRQQSGDLTGARALYEQVIADDAEGILAPSATKALAALDQAQAVETEAVQVISSSSVTAEARPKRILNWFYDLPVRRKQLVGLFTSEVISVGGLVLVAGALLVAGGRAQLVGQSRSELAVTNINYGIKINQMGFGFRGQSDNPAIIAASAAGEWGLTTALRDQVQQILQNEITVRTIEYATLVDRDRRIVVSANRRRQGESFDPSGLVSAVLANPTQIRTTEIVSWEDLERERPPLPEGPLAEGFMARDEDVLVRYTATPVFSLANEDEVLGVLISGDIVNGKLAIARDTQNAFDGGYSAVYGISPDQTFFMATGLAQQDDDTEIDDPQRLALPDSFLNAAVAADGEVVSRRLRVAGTDFTMAARALNNFAGDPVAVLVRGTPEAELNSLLFNNLLLGALVVAVALLADLYLASVLGRSIVTPVKQLQDAARRFTQGDRQARAEVFAEDEVGDLTRTFNLMADSIDRTETELEAQSRQRQQEAVFQRQEKERLQGAVVKLLLDIEGARKGDLTVQAEVDDQEMGSVADAFNATIRSLRAIVSQVIDTSDQVQAASRRNEALMQHLAGETDSQAQAITSALRSVEEMEQSIRSVAQSAQAAAAIAQQALIATTEGEATMDQTVSSIENIRTSAAETAKKVKRLAESSQEISKIIGIISGISEKTNLLAFNASIEAARAGENGQGFRIVADEVRRLAERVTESTQEIEQLISTIQTETSEVLQQMEASTSQVVTGTQLVSKTKLTLQQLGEISNRINSLLQSISSSTVSQTEASALVTQTMQAVVAIATNASQESRVVSGSLQELVDVATTLQASVSKFRVE